MAATGVYWRFSTPEVRYFLYRPSWGSGRWSRRSPRAQFAGIVNGQRLLRGLQRVRGTAPASVPSIGVKALSSSLMLTRPLRPASSRWAPVPHSRSALGTVQVAAGFGPNRRVARSRTEAHQTPRRQPVDYRYAHGTVDLAATDLPVQELMRTRWTNCFSHIEATGKARDRPGCPAQRPTRSSAHLGKGLPELFRHSAQLAVKELGGRQLPGRWCVPWWPRQVGHARALK